MIRFVASGRAPQNIQLTPRDYKILELGAKHRFITVQDIACLWANPKSHHHYERLSELCRAGLIQRLFGDHNVKLGFRITRKGIAWLPTADLKAKALGMRRIGYKTSYGHDRLLNQVQSALETLPIVSNFLSEPEVKSLYATRHGKKERKDKGHKVPDGLFHLASRKGNYRVAIEVELSVKAEARYQMIFRQLLLQPDFDIVFYLTESDDIQKMLMRILADVKANDLVVQTARCQNSIYFADLNELLKNKEQTVFEGEGTKFSLHSLVP